MIDVDWTKFELYGGYGTAPTMGDGTFDGGPWEWVDGRPVAKLRNFADPDEDVMELALLLDLYFSIEAFGTEDRPTLTVPMYTGIEAGMACFTQLSTGPLPFVVARMGEEDRYQVASMDGEYPDPGSIAEVSRAKIHATIGPWLIRLGYATERTV